MSRIHEALKRAEQERATIQGGAAQAELAPVYVGRPVHEDAVPAAVREETGAGSQEGILSGCAAMEWNPDPASMLFTNGNDSARGTEEYRTLRSRLYQLREKMPLKKLLVTSALPKEGKSFTSINLAHVMARQHGRRVLLIDADLRGPRLHLMLGAMAGPGLSDYLSGKNDEFSIMQRAPVENLFFIPSGSGIEDPSELIGNGRLRLLLQHLDPLFEWIVIDSPPAVPVSDASVLATACDGVLMVVRSNSTPANVAQKARREFREQSLVGVVLNGTQRDAADYERYYYETYEKKGSRTKTQGE
jgi:protein-tyrosine kinase